MKHTLKFTVNSHQALKSSSEMKWSYFNVYFLSELRDLYLVCYSQDIEDIPSLLSVYQNKAINSVNGKAWNKRNLLELANALKKIGLISNKFSPLYGMLFTSEIGHPLTTEDKKVFREIFHTYERFKDFHNLFDEGGFVVASKKNGCRFFNSFIVGVEDATEYYIPDSSSEVMRFWDVFLKWGAILGEYERCLFKSIGLDYNLDGLGISWVYRTKEIPEDFSVLEFATKEIGTQYISIIDLIWLIVKSNSFSIDDIKRQLLDECLDSDKYSLQSTSAIFIEEEEKRMLPKIGTTYMSHLLRLN